MVDRGGAEGIDVLGLGQVQGVVLVVVLQLLATIYRVLLIVNQS